MRSLWLLLALAGCSGETAVTDAGKGSPPAPPARPAPGPDLAHYRGLLEQQEARFRAPGAVTAHLDEEVMVGDLRVKVLEIVEDSRCPIDAECMTSGPVRLRVQIGGRGEQAMALYTPFALPGGQTLTLIGVMPPKWSDPPAGVDPHEPPRFAFRLSRRD